MTDAGSESRPCAPATSRKTGTEMTRKRGAVKKITLISKPGCHLCDDARAVIAEIAAETGVEWEEVNMLDDAELTRKYAEQIPVTLIDGKQHDYWRVNPDRLRKALQTR